MSAYLETARLVNRTTLRAMRFALEGDVGPARVPDSPDPALVDVLDDPFDSVPETAERLSTLESRLRAQGDRRAVFLTIYTRMTREVQEGIERGQFADPDWMRQYVCTFANYYRRAFLAYERGAVDDVPDPWQVAFDTAVAGDALVVQDAFLGVNAHINYDLALAVRDVGIDLNREQKYADHRAINEVLAGLVDAQQDALAAHYAAGIDEVDDTFGRLDESLTLLSMREGREQAWRVAVVLTDIGLAPVTAAARWLLCTTATGGALFVRGPALDSGVYRTLRTVESDGPPLDAVLETVTDRFDARD